MNNKQIITNNLMEWYHQHARILPWRKDASAYHVWVSEIMLQQTRVEAVKPYFERFIDKLPCLHDLAMASEDDLHKLWEGLGYYHRVMNMKKAAVLCMEHYHGELPQQYDQLLTLPGIGPYSAGAIASIAFKQKVAAIDGNVLRVFSRLLMCKDDIAKERTKKKFQTIVLDYIPDDRPDIFNQAIMELGAIICVPNAEPRCSQCPLQKECLANLHQVTNEIPVKTGKKKRTIDQKLIDVIVCEHEVLLHQRDQQGLLAGMYEFMMFENEMQEDYFLKSYEILQQIALRDAKHIFSHKEWHMKGKLIIVKHKQSGIWATTKQLKYQYAIPTALKVYKEAVLQWLQK